MESLICGLKKTKNKRQNQSQSHRPKVEWWLLGWVGGDGVVLVEGENFQLQDK